jgi:hypothetical protein
LNPDKNLGFHYFKMGVEGSSVSENQIQFQGYDENEMLNDGDASSLVYSSESYAEVGSYSDFGYPGGC